ncbi:MAG: AMP-binding protein [Ardenticatenaceae bacterium]|nr:AMP-binding protein [Ardenticatenaceae bacterium]
MSEIENHQLLWQPDTAVVEQANLTHYMRWLAAQKDLHFHTYHQLWTWSVENIADFWESLWDYFGLTYSQRWETPLASREMPGAQWFPGARLNYAENIFARMTSERPMMLYKAEDEPLIEISWQSVYDQANRLAEALRQMGVQPGDRVVAYLPNIPQTITAVLAVASLGAIWSSCSPDFGSRSIGSLQPDRTKVLARWWLSLRRQGAADERAVWRNCSLPLPTIEQTILNCPFAKSSSGQPEKHRAVGRSLVASPARADELCQVPFDHPLWCCTHLRYNRGCPSPSLQSHGGHLAGTCQTTIFHNDLKNRATVSSGIPPRVG